MKLPYSRLFLRGKFFTNRAILSFSRGKFSRIVTDCKEYLLKVSISRVKFSQIVFDS